MATLTVAVTLTAAAGGPFSDALATSLPTTYTVDSGNKIQKIKLTASAQQILEADDTGTVLLVIKNLSSTNTCYIHNTASNTEAGTRVATLSTGEVAVIPSSGNADVYVTGTADEYVEIMAFTKS